jgi:hypothetical protein
MSNMPKPKHLLTKSAFVNGLTCERLFWIYQNERKRLPKPDESRQAIFDQGHAIGNLAKNLYPNGIEVDWSLGHDAGIAQTRTVVNERRPIFEAGFQHGRTHARADILNPAGGGRWDLIEVKSSTQVKEEHLQDVAFQKHVYEKAGIRIGRCAVMHVDRTYVRRGELDYKGLLKLTEVTDEIRPLAGDLPAQIKRLLSVMSKAKPPSGDLRSHCSACDLYGECWSFLPERHVFQLRNAGQKAYELMGRHILALKDIPEDYRLTPKQSIQVACERTGKPHIEPRGIQTFLKQLEYPLYFLDFETFMMAVPPYDEMSPYEQVPFQYSLHILPSAKAKTAHYSYLSDGTADPRPEILSGLKAQLRRTGSIVAYNATFENNVLKSCASHFPQYGAWAESIRPRFVDLLHPFREFHYYHPDQNGSASLKQVLPVMTGRSYAGLEIADGQAASMRFRDMAFGNLAGAKKKEIRKALEVYCHQDTEGMIEIVQAMQRL